MSERDSFSLSWFDERLEERTEEQEGETEREER